MNETLCVVLLYEFLSYVLRVSGGCKLESCLERRDPLLDITAWMGINP